MSFFQFGMLVEGMTSTATAAGTTTLTSTSKQIQYFTGTTTQTVKLPATTGMAVGQFFEIFNGSTGPLTIQFQDATSFTPNPLVFGGTSLIVKLVSVGTTNGTWAIVTSGVASPGGKNYLSSIVTSQSTTPNTGNGNFETGGTSGWSLAHSSLTSTFPSTVGTAGNSFSSAGGAHGGSAASGNLSIATVSSGQLAGTYSLSYASSAATTAGDMLISDAFNIDTEDQAKIMTFSFAYKAQSNPTNGNFSGTSSNSFAVAIYDVTNAVWIQPAGVYNLVQNSGVGVATGTFQTTSNSTQYQIAVYNANASAGAITMYLDDFVVGPQVIQKGGAITDPVAYTPTFTGFGTVTVQNFVSWRIGAYLHVEGTFTAGTPTGTEARITLGFNGANSSVTSVSTLTSPQLVGKANSNSTSSTDFSGVTVLCEPSVGYFTFGKEDSSENGVTKRNGNSLVGAGGLVHFFAKVAIAGWSSNSVMSNDTDTRVVAARSTGATATVTSTYSDITWPTINSDTHGSFNAASNATSYSIPVSGYYNFSGQVYLSATTIAAGNNFTVSLFNNTTSTTLLETDYVYEGTNTSSEALAFNYKSVFLNAGTVVKFQIKSTTTAPVITSSSTFNFLGINRQSGPAVVAATETVKAKYYASANTTPGNNSAINFDTKVFDSHNAVTTGTGNAWKFTTPVSGLYSVTGAVATSSTTASVYIKKNGTGDTYIGTISTANSSLCGLIQLNAGDTIALNPDSNNPTIVGGLSSSSIISSVTIVRVGN